MHRITQSNMQSKSGGGGRGIGVHNGHARGKEGGNGTRLGGNE